MKAQFKDISAYATWYLPNAARIDEEIRKDESRIGAGKFQDELYARQDGSWSKWCDCHTRQFGALYRSYGWHSNSETAEETAYRYWHEEAEKHISVLKDQADYLQEIGQKFKVIVDAGLHAIIGTGFNDSTNHIVFNYREWLELDDSDEPKYLDVTVGQMKQLAGMSNSADSAIALSDGSLTVNGAKERQATLEQMLRDVKDYKTPELRALKEKYEAAEAALRKQKEEMLAAMNAMMEELEDQTRQMQVKILQLESEIYSIRCYMGETVNFIQLRSGRPAPSDAPVVLYQKIHYLDEDLGRFVSLYHIEADELDKFERLLKHRNDVVDTFCYGDKAVSLVRLSRNSTYFYGDAASNLLTAYQVYHGTQIGILVRNGENLYMGWTDPDKINIPDDFFFVPGEAKIVDAPIAETDRRNDVPFRREPNKKALFETAMRKAKEFASREFLFSIVQGCIDAERPILTFSRKIDIRKPDPLVILSAADNWLEDKRFPSFDEMKTQCNSSIRVGDHILTLQGLTPHRLDYVSNDRGRGYANRTHDCSVDGNKIYAINLIDTKLRYYDVYRTDNGEIKRQYVLYESTPMPKIGSKPAGPFDSEYKFAERITEADYNYFVSVPKTWSCHDARSNFEVYTDEFINLEFMNSKWLEYIISTKKIGCIKIGGCDVDYAHLIRYLNTALAHVRHREEEELATLTTVFDTVGVEVPNDWQITLSEWKLEKGVRKITEYQAKRFAKSISPVVN